MIQRLLPSCLWVSAEARIIQFVFPIHDTADTQRHSSNNLYVCVKNKDFQITALYPRKTSKLSCDEAILTKLLP